MKKRFVLLILLMLLCGCTTNYRLEIKNDSFKEHIEFYREGNINEEVEEFDENGVEYDDPFPTSIDQDIEALKSKNYKKTIKSTNDGTLVTLDYTYGENEFSNARSISSCFSNSEFSHKDKYYIHLSGTFYCRYSNEVKIEIYTKNKVLSNNADEINGNSYIWYIN